MFIMLVTLLFCVVAEAVAQVTNANPFPAGTGLPQTVASYWELAIGAVSPGIVWLVRKIVPSVPKALLPAITPVIGIGLGLLLNKFAGTDMSWLDMGKAGALAVFVRETFNQAVTKRIADDAAPTPAS